MTLDRRALFHGLTGAAALAAFRSDAVARVLQAGRSAAERFGRKIRVVVHGQEYDFHAGQEFFRLLRSIQTVQ